MRKSLQLLLATILCLLFAAPVAAAGLGGATNETITGTLTTVHVDDFGSGREHERYLLASGKAHYEISFPDDGPGTRTGATVTVTGRLEGRTLHVSSSAEGPSFRIRSAAPVEALTASTAAATTGTSGPVAATASTSSTAVAKSFAAILINFTDLRTQPFTSSAVASALYGSSTSLKAYYQEESKGAMTVSGAVFGWYTIPEATSAGCDWTNWVTLAKNAANAAGANLAAYSNVMVFFPNTSACSWAGLGYVGGGVSLLNGNDSVQVMTHEAGHNFGLGHANGYDCTSGGVRVAIAATGSCKVNPYADPFSTMGNNALRHNQGSQLGQLGWLTNAEKVIGAPGKTYTITPYLGPEGIKLVRIPRGDGTFFDLDMRATHGLFDNFAAGSPAVSGVTIRLGVGTASPTSSPQGTSLIDTTPGTSSFADAPLLVGRTLTDPVSHISFTTMSISSAGVVVRVRESIAPSAPASIDDTAAASSVTLTWGAATDNVAVGSYRIARNGTVRATVGSKVGTWTDATVAGSTTYAYTVTALDTSRNAGPAASVSVTTPAGATPAPTPTPTPAPSAAPDTQHPSQPDPVTGTTTASTVSLAWGASSDDVGVAGYVLTRNGAMVTTAAGTAWKDTARAPKTTYTYTIAAVDTAGHVSPTATVTVTTTADTTPPSRPGHFHVVRRSGSYVTFAWNRSTDNVKVIRYYIYRVGRTKPLTWTTRTSIRISTVRGAYYYVRAMDAAHNHSARSYRIRGR